MARSSKVPYTEFGVAKGVKFVIETEIDRSEIPGLLGQDWSADDVEPEAGQ